MITYVDTSTLLKLVVDEAGSDEAAVIWDTADAVASVRLVIVEARAALAAASRTGRLTTRQHASATSAVGELIGDLHLAEVTSDLVDAAAELAEGEGLRGNHAIHLAAGLHVGASIMSSADEDLCAAASRNGMHVANPLDP